MRADELDRRVAGLTLEQKVRLLSGASGWRTRAEPSVGLRELVFSDGPVGVRGEGWDERSTSLTLPSPTALAATWNEDLVGRLGGLLAAEARRKGVDVLLAPTLNLHRSPLGGRHFECFGEDPLLVGRIGAAYVRGVQAGGVAATAKHYVANDSETERLTLDTRVDERTLRELYLAPFEAAVRAGVWVVMSAYNGVNGTTMSESPLLAEPLKGEWGFDGLVVSDWGAVRSTVPAALAAQDLAMPGPSPRWTGPLAAAVRMGDVPAAALDEKVRRLLALAARVGGLDAPDGAVPQPPADAAARALLREAVAAGCVLVRNEGGLLPLRPSTLRSVAVIGPNAARARVQGGGSAGVFPAGVVSPLEGIGNALSGVEVRHAVGAYLEDRPVPLDLENSRDPRDGRPGVLVRLLDDAGGEIHAEHRLWGKIIEPATGHVDRAASIEIRAAFRPDTGGEWRLGLIGFGALTLRVDGRTVLDTYVEKDTDDPAVIHVSPPGRQVVVTLDAGREVELVATRALAAGEGRVFGVTADPPRGSEADELAAAIALAAAADAAIVVVGTTDAIESEGFDRTSLDLPGRQDELAAAVAAANPRTVVVVNSGGPVALPWRDRVPAVLLSWFPGQEAGDGLADVLFGAVEPGGRLPTSWASTLDGLPTVTPVAGALEYAEGLDIGYRGHLRNGREPAYWFGHGLGYTTWSYAAVDVPAEVAAGEPLAVRVRVRNTGERAGAEVVQVYLARQDSAVARPVRWLAGFARAHAVPGAAADVVVQLAERAFQHWAGGWRTEEGRFEVLVGRSAADIRLRRAVLVAGQRALSDPRAITER
ncbi:MAG: glycoside hydrolase family 3 C-terminal domain-containing protein [Mycobacteriales bacterium]